MACVFPADQVIVVGGGLAGVSACNTVLENGGKVVLIDKSSFCGGNSTKATSGINGAGTKTQKAKGIEDGAELFTADTLKGGAKRPELAKVLCENSAADVNWLMDKFDLDLSLVARLGGHSAPRTHRGAERFPGMTITYALIQMVEKVAETTDRARIITKARVVSLIMSGGSCVGANYEKGGDTFREHGPVIFASGGFGADFTSNSLLAQYRPDLMHLPTTNGEHCTGDGIKMGEAIGGKTIDLEWVQVHPTGLVKPDDADAKIKFLAAEALRGVGGLVLDANGNRFANELGRRDYVTGEMWKNKPPFRLCLNKAAQEEIIWHCKHYTGRGVMKFFESGKALAAEIGCTVEHLAEVHEAHYQAALKQEKDPDGGSWPAYPSGKTWDEPSGKTGSGKKFFHNIIPGDRVATEPFYVAIITPVIHYCMGGLEVDVNSSVLSKDTGEAIPGLYAAGEVAGGIHGNNRLGGNSLLDCVVFGRVAGKHAAEMILGNGVKSVDLKALISGGKVGPVEANGAKGYRCEQAIVVGGGLAGVSACNTVMENGGRVLLVDKSSFCGGNSTKATSGINGGPTRSQKAKGIEDSKELFTSDTLKGGAKKPELVKVLCENSGADVEWLMDKFNLDLSLVARLGGHSAPRTHRGAERFPGMTITYALIQMVEKISETTDRARIITKARATDLILDGPNCIGLKYEKGGVTSTEYGPVILATGGFGADFTSNSLLAQYRPDLMHLPTTNGEHCTGDGIKMGEAIGAKTIDLEWVQVHPTGLVKPDDADAKIKFLAAEALRGVGGLVLDANGNRFANELGRRDYVTGEMWKNKPPFRLCLNKAAQEEIIWHCKHYTGRGVMKFFESGKALAAEIGCTVEHLAAVHEQHYQASLKQASDPEGGPYPAYPSGKTWDEPSGKTGSGKKFFHNVIQGNQVATEPFYVAIITPVIHYCMGGLEIDPNSLVVNQSNEVIKGLYAAGEVAGGVHGNNRLGGNSLLDCVVFGRVSGKHAAEWILGDDAKATDLSKLSGGGLSGEVKSSKLSGGAYEDNMNQAVSATPTTGGGGGGGGYTVEEVAKHNKKDDCWVILSGKVLDVTNFLSSHPGGELAILTFAGKDATEEFDMIHPPDVVGKYAPDAIIGQIGAPSGGGGGGPVAPPGMKIYTKEDVAKHTSKTDCWVILGDKVLDVTNFLSQHPGGELAILTFAGKDATEEFDMIHPPDVVGKYAPDAIIGIVGTPGQAAPAATVAGGGGGGGGGPTTKKDIGTPVANHHAWGTAEGSANWRIEGFDDNPGVFIINVKSYIYAALYLWMAIIIEVLKTIFCNNNFKLDGKDGTGLTRSACLLILFMVIHAVGNLHVFAGPDDFNGYGYFYVRLYWTGFGLPANIVEEYILLSAALHVVVGLKRTWDSKLKKGILSGELNLALTGVVLLTFMTIHLIQFRFGATENYLVRPPPYLIYFWGITKLQLFWTDDESVAAVNVRDIYKLEFDRFLGYNYVWSAYYIFSTLIFMTHAILGWNKLTQASGKLGIPKLHLGRAKVFGWLIFAALALIYISFPVYVLWTGQLECGKAMQGDVNINRQQWYKDVGC